MPKRNLHPAGVLVPAALAGIVGTAVVMERRRAQRARPVSIRRAPAAPSGERNGEDPGEREESQDAAQLSPFVFTIFHFGFLIALLVLTGGWLSLYGIRNFPPETRWHVNGGDPEEGREALIKYGCGGCHQIPGIRDANGRVGPPLEDFGERIYIGGQLPNVPENLIAWIRNPQRYAPGTAMPNLPVGEEEARDMAAYLYSE